jgi:hypothetical protein
MAVINYAVALVLLGLVAGCVVVAPEQQDNKTPVCHKGKKTIYVGDSAVDAHLKHGDYVGVCR